MEKTERGHQKMNEKVVNAALLGLGTVGTGVYKVIKSQEQEMTAKLGCQVKITKILVRNLEKASGKVDDPSVLTTDWADIEGDPSIDIVIELIGGIEPARTYILAALKAGKNVVTANKDLIAVHGKEILETARAAQKDFLFEAAVAGGIPIISPLKNSLEANHVTEVMGIVNGTTNFILTKMSQEGMEFSDALALATELGYAEADPTADIEGIDAGRKVAILASVAFNSRVTLDNVHIEGITKITAKDIRYAKEMGCHTVGLSCNPGSAVGGAAELAIEVVPGPECLTGSTRLKAGTAQKLILNMISTATMVRCGKAFQNLMVDVVPTNEKLRVRAENIVMEATGVAREQAQEALLQAGDKVKTAILMILVGCGREEAEEKLEKTNGHIREAMK